MGILYRYKNNSFYLGHFAIVGEDDMSDLLDAYYEKIDDPKIAHSRIKKGLNIFYEGKMPKNVITRNILRNHYIASRILRDMPTPDYPELTVVPPSDFKMDSIEFEITKNIFERISGEDFERYFMRNLIENEITWDGIEPPIREHDLLLKELQGIVSGIVGRL